MSDENREEIGATTAGLFDRLATNDPNAENDLLVHFKDRIERLTRVMFHKEGRLPDLHQTADVEQGAVIRLLRTLKEERPKSALHFMRLVATCVRRELWDLARKEYGPHGDGGRVYANRPADSEQRHDLLDGRADPEPGPATRADLAEVHEMVLELPEPEREAFELIHYGGHTHQEVADRVGVSVSTVKRRYYDAYDLLEQRLKATRS
ncbi:MAG: hypothetical protein C0467_29625 [Planctomycetaceae bacterium]|nr:hypothetical protein [Planctomycetaceae bacterium]